MANMSSGTVQTVSKTNKGVLINDAWYNSKAPAFKDLSKGSVVSFEYEVGNQGGNFLVGKVSEESKGSGGPASSGGGAKKAYGGKSNNYEVGAAVGMAVNNGVLLSIAEGKGFDEAFIKAAALKVYTLAESMKEKAANGDFEKKKVEEKAVPVEGIESDDLF